MLYVFWSFGRAVAIERNGYPTVNGLFHRTTWQESTSLSRDLVSMKRATMNSFWVVCILYISITTVCSSENITESAALNGTTLHPHLDGKHESLSSCMSFQLEPDEYELLANGSAYIKMYNLSLDGSHYILANETLSFCVPFEPEEVTEKEQNDLMSYLTVVGLGISMISLFAHLVVFFLVKDLRNLPGWNLAALCASLFISYFLLLLISSESILNNRDACKAAASVTHFFLLSSFLWMFIMSCDVLVSLLRATGSLRTSSTQFKARKFGVYCLSAFGIALLFTILGALSDSLDSVPQKYRPEFQDLCWFSQKIPLLIFFAGPVFFLACLNFLFFGISAYLIHSNKRQSNMVADRSDFKRRYMMYFRLSVLMGVTWKVGIAANIVNADWLWCIFIVLNTLQGFFIFLAFTCSKKVKKYFREKFRGVRRKSQQTLTTPTFQSYCFYANSIEKDLDKIVESNKGKIETIIIHL